MLEALDLHRRYRHRRVHALGGVSLAVRKGGRLGIVGPSGSGKSTLARCLVGLERPDAGEIRLDGRRLGRRGAEPRRHWVRRVQMIWQEPRAALSPFVDVGTTIGEPLENFATVSRAERADRVAALMEAVGLSPGLMVRRPAGLSGGQCQRVVIARALAATPDYLVCDEPLSALDCTTQAQILDLLDRLTAELGLAVILISHDLAVLRGFVEEVAVLADGRIVERGPAAILDHPQHPVTRALKAAELVPELGPPATGTNPPRPAG
ncbi:MAG: ATP-binding cassette domain-containing protein [Dongiaceae bacterium]